MSFNDSKGMFWPQNKVVPKSQKGNYIQMPSEKPEFEVFWHNLSYKLPDMPLFSKSRRLILDELSGNFRSSEVTAIMGPSGAGKSTFLEILCGRRKGGVKGEIRVRGMNKLKIGFVPQDNYLLELLTVRETFIFSSYLINSTFNNSDHKLIAEKLIQRFGLESITDTKAYRCSGGQRKRMSIALEVLSNPNLLVLDEPTTGLDSPSCAHVMQIMQELVGNTRRPVALVTTIHQPSVATFSGFHWIYILTAMGQCLYQGPPQNLISTINRVGLKCDTFTSPADYIIEIAANDYGPEPIKRLCYVAKTNEIEPSNLGTRTLESTKYAGSHPFIEHVIILWVRSQVMLYRDPLLTVLRLFVTFFSAISLAILFGRKVGTVSGCAPRKLELYATPLDVLSGKFETDLNLIMQNVCLLFLAIMVGFISGLTPTLLTFPKEMHVFYKEYHNGWYSCMSYYLARMFSDGPLQMATPVIFCTIIYYWTGQPLELYRFIGLLFNLILLSLLAQSIGECASAIFMGNQSAAVFTGGLIPLPMILFGGFLVRVERMPVYLQPLSWLSFMRFSFESMIVSTYGFNRCEYNYQQFLKTLNGSQVEMPFWAQSLPLIWSLMDGSHAAKHRMTEEENLKKLYSVFGGGIVEEGQEIDLNKSLILQYFYLEDWNIITSLGILFLYMGGLKVLTYFVLLLKLNSTK